MYVCKYVDKRINKKKKTIKINTGHTSIPTPLPVTSHGKKLREWRWAGEEGGIRVKDFVRGREAIDDGREGKRGEIEVCVDGVDG